MIAGFNLTAENQERKRLAAKSSGAYYKSGFICNRPGRSSEKTGKHFRNDETRKRLKAQMQICTGIIDKAGFDLTADNRERKRLAAKSSGINTNPRIFVLMPVEAAKKGIPIIGMAGYQSGQKR